MLCHGKKYSCKMTQNLAHTCINIADFDFVLENENKCLSRLSREYMSKIINSSTSGLVPSTDAKFYCCTTNKNWHRQP